MIENKLEIFKTEDGSDSLFNPTLGEVYHSKHGAVNESKHVFIEAGLNYLADQLKTIKILEIGFGTGLNTLLTLDYCYINDIKAHYHTLEPFPVNAEIYSKLNYSEFCKIPGSKLLFDKLHESNWNKETWMNDQFLLYKSTKRIEKEDIQHNNFNLVYFDAFAPDIQPELWTESIFNILYNCMEEKGVLVTYAAKGQVRRNMQSVGFRVERIPGPKGKREMLRATK